MDFFLSYEGVHEVSPLCGAKDHSLVSCPSKPKNNIELVVAQFEASNLEANNLPRTKSDWIHVKPQRRARPRAFGFWWCWRFRRGTFPGPTPRHSNSSPPAPVPAARNSIYPAVSLPFSGDVVVPTANAFALLQPLVIFRSLLARVLLFNPTSLLLTPCQFPLMMTSSLSLVLSTITLTLIWCEYVYGLVWWGSKFWRF